MENSKSWNVVERIIDAADINVKEKALLLVIYRYEDVKTGYAVPSRKMIKKKCRILDNGTLDRLFRHIIEKGYLTRISGRGTRSRYFIR